MLFPVLFYAAAHSRLIVEMSQLVETGGSAPRSCCSGVGHVACDRRSLDESSSYRREVDEDLVWSTTGIDVFEPSIPWRTFRWREGQKHYSGLYWSSTMRDHVVYESRLELTRLLYADFDQVVTGVFAQPFLLSTTVDGRRRRHVPDFLVMREKEWTSNRGTGSPARR